MDRLPGVSLQQTDQTLSDGTKTDCGLLPADGETLELFTLFVALGCSNACAEVAVDGFDHLIIEGGSSEDRHRELETKQTLTLLDGAVRLVEGGGLSALELASGCVPEVDIQRVLSELEELIVALDTDRLGVREELVQPLPVGTKRTLGGRLVPDVGVTVDVVQE